MATLDIITQEQIDFHKRGELLDKYFSKNIQQQAWRELATTKKASDRNGTLTLTWLIDNLEKVCQRIKASFTAARREAQKQEITKANNQHIMYVTLCEITNCYGGPEEGGWYYDSCSPIKSVAVMPDISQARLEKIKAKLLSEVHGEDNLYTGHGCGGAGDDWGLLRGEEFNSGYGFRYTRGV